MSAMRTLQVDLGPRSYPIYIGPGLLDRSEWFVRHIPGRRVLVVSNETVAPLYLERLQESLGDFQCDVVILPDGERYKTLEVMGRVFDALLERRHDRETTLIALGGGVIGDIAGFAAACYQRGVPFIQVPTTLLAQVDSSVGGKTGVNHPLGKNMIGAFHQPRCVVADTDTLATLDERQLCAGIAEIIKYGLIQDREFFEWLEAHMEALLGRESEAVAFAVERSCHDKAQVVAVDERESGPRALLNLGHTFGHAIETGIGYGTWLHGEAVAAGMCMAARLSVRQGWLAEATVERIEALVRRARLPVIPPAGIDPSRLREWMAVDKKARDGRLRLVLLRGIGRAVLTDDFDEAALTAVLEDGAAAAGA
jgi:3-dehydroquinate synthase